jgi:uncharacterized phiE125 gp8 family phage protein
MRTVLRLVTPATERAVGLNEARRHLSLDDDMSSDDLVNLYLEAAEQSLAYVGRALKPATYALDVYGYPHPVIEIPMPPLRAVTLVQASSGATGSLETVDPANYSLETEVTGRTRIRMAPGYIWPYFASGYVTASVTFTAGYDTVPSALRAAILLIVGSLFENRSEASPVPMTKLPFGVDGLVSPYRDVSLM